MNHELTIQQMQALVKEYVSAARMYNHIVWRGVRANKLLDHFEFPVDVKGFKQLRGEAFGKARWWRQRILDLTGQ